MLFIAHGRVPGEDCCPTPGERSNEALLTILPSLPITEKVQVVLKTAVSPL